MKHLFYLHVDPLDSNFFFQASTTHQMFLHIDNVDCSKRRCLNWIFAFMLIEHLFNMLSFYLIAETLVEREAIFSHESLFFFYAVQMSIVSHLNFVNFSDF